MSVTIIPALIAAATAFLTLGVIVQWLQTRSGWQWIVWLTQRIAPTHPPLDLPDTLIFRPVFLTERQMLLLVVGAGMAGMTGAVMSIPAESSLPTALRTAWAHAGYAMALTGGAIILMILAAVGYFRHRYQTTLDEHLLSALDRLVTAMDAGRSFSQALAGVIESLPRGPLHTEWRWLLDHLGAQRPDGTRLMLHEVCLVLAMQTPSVRHATVLMRLGDALNRPHDAQVAALRTIVTAMHDAERRASTMRVELAQMRTSGLAIFIINVAIIAYLGVVQWPKMVAAYTGPLGLPAAVIFGSMILAPLVAGQWLSRADDLSY